MFYRFFATGLLLAAFSLPVLPQAPLPEKTAELLRAANISQDALGAIAIRLADGAVVLSHGAERSLQPASTLKLLTSIVGLERLGPTYRGRTALAATAEIFGGRLHGDLFLRGGGSPDFDWRALQRLLQSLRFQGVTRIAGDLVLDRQLFQPPRTDIGVPPFDETPEFRYNVIPDALLLNTNLLQLDLAAGAKSMRARMTPALDRVSIDVADMRFVERACDKWEDGWRLPTVVHRPNGRIHIVLHGEFPVHCSATTHINVLDRVVFTDRVFRAMWRDLGGQFSASVRDGVTPRGARVLAEHTSRTLAEFVRDINKRSDNPVTRLLFLTLGTLPDAEATVSKTDTAARANQVVREWLAAHGLSAEGLVLENGSGLSRRERIRPALLAGVLAAAARSDWAPEFTATLPIVGIDGAMARRLRESPAAIKGRFKTGSLRNVVSVAGYVPDATGQMLAVVAIINHEPWGEAGQRPGREVLDSLIDWAARSGAK